MDILDFLAEILPETPEFVEPVFCVLFDAPGDNTPWPPRTEQTLLSRAKKPDGRAFYVSTMLAAADDDGRYRNRQSSFWGLNMVVLDDIGTKVDPNNLAPTYVIESSEGNFQWGYVLKEPLRNREMAGRLVSAIYETELSDGGGKMVNKYVRLPIGINGKGDPRNEFKVRLVSSGGPLYTVEELIEGFGVTLAPEAGESDAVGLQLPIEDYQRVPDRLGEWFNDHKLLLGDGDPFMDIVCPWHLTHTDQADRRAGYSPLGRGEQPDTRGFHCFHDSCRDRRTSDLLEWVVEQGGPSVEVWDPIAPLVARFVLLEHSNEVADTWATAVQPYPITALSHWKNAHKQWRPGARGRRDAFCDLWLADRNTVRCKGRTYDPGGPAIKKVDGELLFNTYRRVNHPRVTARPDSYLEHIDWLIPDEGEREVFHSWIAYKLQNPASRSYGMVLVADLGLTESGHRYGTGRSLVGDILRGVFQAGVKTLDLSDLTGKGDSQTAYNDWAAEAQLCVVEETKEEISNWKVDSASYEGLKKVVDPKPTKGVRVKPKYGRIFETTLYANFLFFTNHSDALQLPEDDRRFCVLDCAKGRREEAVYGELVRISNSPRDLAAVYWWYLSRDLNGYSPVYPPDTPAKQKMVGQSKGSVVEVWEQVLDDLPGALVTRQVLTDKAIKAAGGDEELAVAAKRYALSQWRKLGVINKNWVVVLNKKNHRARILRDEKEVRVRVVQGDTAWLRGELSKNL